MALMVMLTVGCGATAPSAPPGSGGSPAALSPDASGSATSAPSASRALPAERRLASTGTIAVLAGDGSLSLVDTAGRSRPLAAADDGVFGFPTWSPDGTLLAAVRNGDARASLLVFDTRSVSADRLPQPTTIFENPAISPFYLYWTPDGRDVSFLATEGDELSLRLAPADASAPLDGSGPGAKVHSGNPFYYDWIGEDRLLAHIGVGPEAFLGEMGLDGTATGDGLGPAGDFRPAVVNGDATSIAYVRIDEGGASRIVVGPRDGSTDHTLDVFGSAAIEFDPTGATLASIAPHEPGLSDATFPVGPLRLIDAASGEVRTLIEGLIVSFWWSPDGKTIAALRVQPTIGSAGASASPATPRTEVRLLFVDVESGAVRSQPVVLPGQRFIETFLAFFDQYALSHRLWAPDSSSFLLPEFAADGSTHIAARFPDGEDPVQLDGVMAFWSPT